MIMNLTDLSKYKEPEIKQPEMKEKAEVITIAIPDFPLKSDPSAYVA